MSHTPPNRALPWLEPGQAFPPVETAWSAADPAPGLLAAGGVLDQPTLVAAYSRGIFPWYSAGQPILWWSTDPRMVLEPSAFRLHRSLRKTLVRLLRENRLEVRIDQDFERVIKACAHTPRNGQSGTWILPAMVEAYVRLHQAGLVHSVETWLDGELAGGLYCVNLGSMVFGESMFSRRNDASKIALAGLIAFCRAHDLPLIDCQQNTAHLASQGGHLMTREDFCRHVSMAVLNPAPVWKFLPVYWQNLLSEDGPRA
ncbi:MAG: leucyl/phenylalanyl-tRNA--protein transferase [Hydrogenophaga sp.]|jgi:leucyl/phenylalanyl-tRNA---protein transferase|uniref:leucyl/phenylalanyl-tRNA--protein transferase n=1 Tax=Hydrogenophaga sp. TaxID=1904254 RepID=UPI002636AD51|nr:leucyl/phenylalanyl-tRNA--protein transferase [Hydrogenophaga sp.]MCV0437364.1 leucyl/phenylalanyl-tRNA--protein transferase [Hydrogenophaga sp.]